MLGKRITWADNWYRWEATIAEENGNCYFLSDVLGYSLTHPEWKPLDALQYTGRDKGNVILQSQAKKCDVIRCACNGRGHYAGNAHDVCESCG